MCRMYSQSFNVLKYCTVEAYHAIVDKNEYGKVRSLHAGAGSNT